MQIDAIGEILNISMGSSATSISELLGMPVTITTPLVKVLHPNELDLQTYDPAIGVEINYTEGLDGKNVLILKETDVKAIVGLLLQTDFSEQEFVLDEMNIGAICEVMNQMMGASATALSQFLNRTVNISPPASFPIEDSDSFRQKYFGGDDQIVSVQFDLMIGDLVNSKFINVMRKDLAKELVSYFGLSDSEPEAEAPAPQLQIPQAPVPPVPVPQAAPAPAPQTAAPQMQAAPHSGYREPQEEPPVNYKVSGASFPSFDKEEPKLNPSETSNLGMILSVPLQVTVEIGRTSKKIKEILDFSPGAIVELDKQAGSQVDVFVNGKAIAKGNVVVVDDFYGVRITEVSNSGEIMKLV